MQPLPQSCVSYEKTPIFDETSVPAGLLQAHQTKAGTWGKIVVLQGELLYRILEPAIEEYVLTTEQFGVVEPTVLHEVAPLGQVRFYVDFHRQVD